MLVALSIAIGFCLGICAAFLMRLVSLQIGKSLMEKILAERHSAQQELTSNQALFHLQMQNMSGKLDQVANVVREFEKDRSEKFGELSVRLKEASQRTTELLNLTSKLKESMVAGQARGQLGEKLADDILRFAGFVEGVNYTKQTTIGDLGARPDFTFLLPNKQHLNMDVKFPFARFYRIFETESLQEQEKLKREFIQDVKSRIREVSSRLYINCEQNTVDCVLMFIPSEHVFSFLQAESPEIFDMALQMRVICCSPMTLFPVLSVIRQSVEQFAMEQASKDVMRHVFEFRKQWEKFVEKLEGVGSRIMSLQKEYDQLIGTRRNQLDRTFLKIDAMKHLQSAHHDEEGKEQM